MLSILTGLTSSHRRALLTHRRVLLPLLLQVDELKVKQREEYRRLGVMSDTLAFEMDGPS